jgi:chromosome segregation ATPase
MNRSIAIMAMLVTSFVGAGGSIGSLAFAGDPVCDRFQSELSERDQEVARHREYSSQLFKQLEAARTELESAERANAQAQARANDATLKARHEIMDYEASHQKELVAREKDLEASRSEVVTLRAAVGKLQAGQTQQAAELTAKAEERQKKIAVLEAQAKELQAKAQKAAEKAGIEQLASLRAQVSKLESALAEATAQRDGVVAKRDALLREWKERAQTFSAQLDESQKQIATLVARGKDLDAAREEIASLKKEGAELRAAAAEREAKLMPSVRPAVLKVEAPLAEEHPQISADEQVAGLRAKVENIMATAAQDRKEREKTQADVGRLEQEKQKLAAQLAKTMKARDEAVEKQRTTLRQSEGETAQLVQQLEQNQKRIAELEKRAEGASAQAPVQTAAAVPATPQAASPADQAVAEGSAIKKWEQPDGTLFFGERPHHGSKLLGEVTSMGTAGGNQVN